jgi:hypothetical protein
MKSALVLEGRCGAWWKLGGCGSKLPVRQLLAAHVDDEALLGAALGDRNVPFLRRGAHQHIAGGSACDAQSLVKRRRRDGGALLLRGGLLPESDPVGLPAGHKPNLDALPIGVELLGENLRQSGVGSLPHFGLRQAERNLPARRNNDPVGDFVVRLVLGPHRTGRTHGDRNQQGCGCESCSSKQEAARDGQRHRNPLRDSVTLSPKLKSSEVVIRARQLGRHLSLAGERVCPCARCKGQSPNKGGAFRPGF